jgi:DNA-directed RNA polymerase subunit F
MVERISKLEREAGHYEKPVLEQKSEDIVTDKKVDMVEALLANESRRKQEKEARTKQEDAAASRMKELKAMAVDDLKSALTKKGVEPVGKKEELVEALFAIRAKDDAIMARKADLKSMGLQDLKTLLSSKGLEPNKNKDVMVETMLKHEAKCREDLEAFNAKGKEVLVQKQAELATKTNTELKEMCANKNLALGGGKEERIERLLQEAQSAGEVDKAVVVIVRNTRKEALMAFDKPSLLQLCEATGADPFVKDVMVERLRTHESEEGGCVEPAAKKSRKK